MTDYPRGRGMTVMELKQWLSTNTRDLSKTVLGYSHDEQLNAVRLYFVPISGYEAAYDKLVALGLEYNIEKPWTTDEGARVEGELRIANFHEHDLGATSVEKFGKQLIYYAPQWFDSIGVILVDLVGFTTESSSSQLQLLRQLDFALDTALEESRDQLDGSNVEILEWARASTGDGYFVFPVEPSPVANVRLLRALLVFATTMRRLGIEIRAAYTVGKCFTFYRYDSAEVEKAGEEKLSKAPLNLIGPASNELARVLIRGHPNQFLITEPGVEYLAAQGEVVLQRLLLGSELALIPPPYREHLFQYMQGMGNAYGEALAPRWITRLITLFLSLWGSGVPSDGVATAAFSPPDVMRLHGKHENEEFLVYNLTGTTMDGHTKVNLGLHEDKTTLFEQVYFTTP